eukprot:89734-Hanusia_phi.AAC.2
MEARYLHAARAAGDCVWEYGLLKKVGGYHGACYLLVVLQSDSASEDASDLKKHRPAFPLFEMPHS